jgi:hypothetical protein
MVVRYDPGYDHNNNEFDLEVVDYTTPNNTDPILGKLSSLLQWHIDDPVDDFEINRNDIIYSFQENRNPFIDHPNLVNFIWGDNFGEQWNENLSLSNSELNEYFKIYPNPSSGKIYFNRIFPSLNVDIFSFDGKRIFNQDNIYTNELEILIPKGIYVGKFNYKNEIIYRKIIVK